MPKGIYKRTEEHKRNISKALKGHKLTEETKQNIREAHKGKKLSEDHKRKISISSKGKIPWNINKKLSEETKKKIGKARFRGGSDTYWANELKKTHTKCCLCGSDIKLEMHHKDKNRKNHKRTNLIILCETCHKFWHKTKYRR